jgi:molybdenum cofactor guanylyltransferase/molybdopterin-guanine dinucleotide biosynthesis protein MobB
MRKEIAGVLLAGGLSRRMGGGDKALLTLGGRPLISRVAEGIRPQVDALALNANGDPARFASLDLPIVPDEAADFPGPLAGVLAALHWAQRDHPGARSVLSVPADAPFIPSDLARRLAVAQAGSGGHVAVAASRGRRHHVIALWPLAAAAAIEAALARGDRKVEAMIDALGATAVPFADIDIGGQAIDPFFNVNTPDDLALAERLLALAQTAVSPALGEGNIAAPFVVGVAGWKNSGKTTLVESLVSILVARGLRVATVKHSHHPITGEHEGSDSDRHRRAGANEVALVGADRWAIIDASGRMILQDGPPPNLDGIVARLSPVDIVVVEGMKSAPIPKIEVRRVGQGDGPPLAGGDTTVFAIASDRPIAHAPVPVCDVDDIECIARLVLERRSRTGIAP